MNAMYLKKTFSIKKFHPKNLWPIAVMGILSLMVGCSQNGDSGKDKLKVSEVSPVEGAVSIETSEFVTARFSESLKVETLTAETFTVSTGGVPVDGIVTYDIAKKTAQFAPVAVLSPSAIYLVTLSTAIKSKDGAVLSKAKNWSFTTAAPGEIPVVADIIKPTISSTLPLNNAIGVSSTGDVTATFDEAMLDTSITMTSFKMTGYLGVAVPGAVSTLGSSATFNPTNSLTSGTVYTATVTTNVTDLAGNTLAVDKVWSFTTMNSGPAPILLGMAGNYAILAEAGITNVNSSVKSVITGNLGVSPIVLASMTGFTNMTAHEESLGVIDYVTADEVVGGGKIYAANLTGGTTALDLSTATNDRLFAYNDAVGRTENAILNVGTGLIGTAPADSEYVSGLYKWDGNVHMTGNITLTGGANDVWIFQVGGTMTVDAAMQVTMAGGALAKNVFWQIAGATSLGAGSHFEGIILSASNITLVTGATMNGRALSADYVALQIATVTQPAE